MEESEFNTGINADGRGYDRRVDEMIRQALGTVEQYATLDASHGWSPDVAFTFEELAVAKATLAGVTTQPGSLSRKKAVRHIEQNVIQRCVGFEVKNKQISYLDTTGSLPRSFRFYQCSVPEVHFIELGDEDEAIQTLRPTEWDGLAEGAAFFFDPSLSPKRFYRPQWDTKQVRVYDDRSSDFFEVEMTVDEYIWHVHEVADIQLGYEVPRNSGDGSGIEYYVKATRSADFIIPLGLMLPAERKAPGWAGCIKLFPTFEEMGDAKLDLDRALLVASTDYSDTDGEDDPIRSLDVEQPDTLDALIGL